MRPVSKKTLPLSPTAAYLIVAALICGSVIISLYGLLIYREVNRQEAFLAAHGDASFYLVPVDCGPVPRGEPERDYLRGRANSKTYPRRSMEVCWYSPSTYDRLFAGKFPENGLAAHMAQANETGVDLLMPFISASATTGFGIVIFASVATAIFALRNITKPG